MGRAAPRGRLSGSRGPGRERAEEEAERGSSTAARARWWWWAVSECAVPASSSTKALLASFLACSARSRS
eukprot:4702577-Prymnesium_polylepis.1